MPLEPKNTMLTGQTIEYFEIDSAEAGTRYAIAVVLPDAYGLTDEAVPVIYAPDANSQTHTLAAVARGHMNSNGESIAPVRPCIQVMIGYPDAEVPYALGIRNRDLLPPGEPYPPRMDGYLPVHLDLEGGAFPADFLDVFRKHIGDPHNDRFLAFIENELHPEIAQRYRVLDTEAGLFGFSYGGLFALCAMAYGSRLFTNFGASSPALLADGTRIHALYEEFAARTPALAREQHVHISITDYELTGPTGMYRTMGIETMKLIDLMLERPVEGLELTTEIVLGQDHGTGVSHGYESFLRTRYAAV